MLRAHKDYLVDTHETVSPGTPDERSRDIVSFSVKVGNRVPDDAVNLAFFSKPSFIGNTKDGSPSVVHMDYGWIDHLVGKRLITDPDNETGTPVIYNNLHCNTEGVIADGYGHNLWDTKDLLLTDEYSIQGTPLFYKQYCSQPVTISNLGDLVAYSALYINEHTDPVTAVVEDKLYTYIGSKIRIYEVLPDGSQSQISSSLYKIVVSKHPSLSPNVFSTYVLINDDYIYSGKNHVIKYLSYDNNQVEDVLSPLPVFYLNDGAAPEDYDEFHLYSINEVNGKYQVSTSCDLTTITAEQRNPIYFRYKVYADLNQTISAAINYKVNVGLIFSDGILPEINACKNILSVLSNSNGTYSIPSNIELVNPNSPYGTDTNDTAYWVIDPSMPLTQWLNYDVIFVTGSGITDLSFYASKFHAFLENGGKLFVENLSNDATERFIPKFNTTESNKTLYSILDVAVDPQVSPASAVITTNTSPILSTMYMIGNTDCQTIRYFEGVSPVQVSIPLVFGPSDSVSNWTVILKDANNKPVLISKRYNNKGTIYYSNMASIRQARETDKNTGALKLLANIIISGVRNKYVTSPWLYSYVMHKNNLYDQEYRVNGNDVYVDSTVNGQIVAKKILADSPRTALIPYMDRALYSAEGVYHVDCQQLFGTTWRTAGDVMVEYSSSGTDKLLAYTNTMVSSSYSPSWYGQTQANIVVIPRDISFNFRITPTTYKYVNGIYTKISADPTILSTTITSLNGMSRVNYLSPILPAIPSGLDWERRTDIFYEIAVDQIDSFDQSVNLFLYNVASNTYKYSNDGTITVGYDYVSQTLSNLILFAQTDIYDIGAQASRYCARQNSNNTMIYPKLPEYPDAAERWNLLIHNGSFIGDASFFDVQNHPDSTGLLAELRDYVVKYDTSDLYANQAFILMPGYRQVVEERATFINRSTIRVNFAPIYMSNAAMNQERLSPIGNNTYACSNKEIQGPIHVFYLTRDPNTNETATGELTADQYTVDTANGLVHMVAPLTTNAIAYYMSYNYQNLKVIRRSAANKNSIRERLNNHLGLNQFKLRYSNLASVAPFAPVLYTFNGSTKNIIDPNSYVVDYLNGVVMFNDTTSPYEIMYADYTYYVQNQLTVTKYNKLNGTISVKEPIRFTDEIYVSYSYKSNYYIYNGYRDEAERLITLDLNPSDGHMSYQDSVIVEGSTVASGEYPTMNLMNKEIFVYMLPYSKTNRATGVTTYQRNCIRHCVGEGLFKNIQKQYPTAILLTTLTISNPFDIDDFTLLDTRVRGGGLKENVDPSTLGYAQYLWDVSAFDGMIYQANGVIVIKVPSKTLKENGGQFEKDDIETIVYNNIPLGIYPIIEYV